MTAAIAACCNLCDFEAERLQSPPERRWLVINDILEFPLDRSNRFVLPAELRRAQSAGHPVLRVRRLGGDEVWMVIGYEEVKALYADPRLRRTNPNEPRDASEKVTSELSAAVQADANHKAFRSRLGPCFSPQRLRRMRPGMERIVESLLDQLEYGPLPADFHADLSFPLPTLVMCGVLGVPTAEFEKFRKWAGEFFDFGSSPADAMRSMTDYMRGLVARKRAEPDESFITDLIAAEDGGLDDDTIAGLAVVMMLAGHVSTVERIDVGMILLMMNPDQWAQLCADPSRVAAAVEEINRLATVSGRAADGTYRYACSDIPIAGVTIRAGETVLLCRSAASRDESVFANADRFDLGRQPIQNLEFAHGQWYCIGAALARMELAIVFERLARRFPAMRLAVAPEAVEWRQNSYLGGVLGLPVTWSRPAPAHQFCLRCPATPRAETIWGLWRDARTWPAWAGVDSAAFGGSFVPGSTGFKKVAGRPPVPFRLVQVFEGNSWTSESENAGTMIRTHHRIEGGADSLTVMYYVEIFGDETLAAKAGRELRERVSREISSLVEHAAHLDSLGAPESPACPLPKG